MRELTDNECDAIIDDAMENSGSGFVRIAYAYVRAGHAAGYRAAQAARPPREPTQAMMVGSDFVYNDRTTRLNIWRAMHDAWTQEQTSGGTQQRPEQANASKPESRPGPLDHQSAVGTNCATECAVRAPESFARGPAADPIADLCARLRDYTAPDYIDGVPTACEQDRAMLEAADALERQASEIADLNRTWKAMLDRAERAEAERDALRECVRAADGLRAECDQVPPMVQQRNVLHAYDAASAKVKP